MKKIRVGLLVDDMLMPAWVQRMLEMIADEEGVEISLVVKNAAARQRQALAKNGSSRNAPLLYSAWRALDKRLFKVTPDAFRMVDLSPLLSQVATIDVMPERSGGEDRFSATDLERIARHEIDVFVQMGFAVLRGDILGAASCGIWSYHPGAMEYGAGSEAAWEVLANKGITHSVLQMHAGGQDGSGILYKSWSSTDPFSANRNLNNSYWKALLFVPRKLRELKQIGRTAFMNRYAQQEADKSQDDGRQLAMPDNMTSAKLLTALFVKKISDLVRRSHAMHQWMLLYRFGESGALPAAMQEFKQLLPPRDRFWADPCVVEHQGKHVVFIEELEYANNRGFLSVIEFDSDGDPVLPPVKILEKPYHLSYPFVFEDDDVLYMIPETMQNETIELYRCVEFPHKWEFAMNLMENIRAVDATLWRHEGKYWLFANVIESPGASPNDELFLYFSDSLLSSRWQPHPCNPIVSDTRCARPAGRIFQHGGHWYRPAQDCSHRYGKAMSLQRIDRIDEGAYRENPVSRIDPDWDSDIICTHTLSQMGRLMCMDGLRKRSKF